MPWLTVWLKVCFLVTCINYVVFRSNCNAEPDCVAFVIGSDGKCWLKSLCRAYREANTQVYMKTLDGDGMSHVPSHAMGGLK